MKLNFCAVCGTENDLQQHHIEPVVFTGIKRRKKKNYNPDKKLKECDSLEIFAYLYDKGIITDDGEITVCSFHHHLMHGIVKFQKHQHSNMIKEGQQKALAKGIKIGRPSKMNKNMINIINEMRSNGKGIKRIAHELGIGIGTVYGALKEKTNG